MEKVVQTTLPADTYTRLWERAKKEGKPLKAVVQEAIEAFLVQDLPAWEDDPLQAFIGSVASDPPANLSDKRNRMTALDKHRRKTGQDDGWGKRQGARR